MFDFIRKLKERNKLFKQKGLVVVLVDMQPCFIENLDEDDAKRIIRNQIKVIRYCAHRDIPAVVLEFEDYESTIEELDKHLRKIKRLMVIIKRVNNGFYETSLDYHLRNLGAKKLFLMGVNADACVRETAKDALKKGYKIITGRDFIASASGQMMMSWYRKNGTVLRPDQIF